MYPEIVNLLATHARKVPDKTAFISFHGHQQSTTYQELKIAVDALSGKLTAYNTGQPAILMYEDPLEFLIAFLACQQLGIIAVPMFYPNSKRHFGRLDTIIKNVETDLICCEESAYEKIKNGLPTAKVVTTTHREGGTYLATDHHQHISFLQYTSGSTGDPKGVIITHANLMHNQQLIQETFQCNADSIILSWLPFYHDMGLIGNLLHTIYTGCTCILMSPLSVIQQPLLWLQAISDYKVTHSGGPNFVYDLCVQRCTATDLAHLDLSPWKVAYNGAEPIRSSTVEGFIALCADAGFSPNAYYVCYGLAEATLLVAGGVYDGKGHSGRIAPGTEVSIINDEICIAGPSVSEGYWRQPGNFYGAYLRTGDIGSVKEGKLYIAGRLKESIIINGRNYFPYDVESEISRTIDAVYINGVVVSFVTRSTEVPIVFAELSRRTKEADYAAIIQEIDRLVVELLGVEAHDILLLLPRQLPRTSSGKLRRLQCKADYENGLFSSLAAKRSFSSSEPDLSEDIRVHQRYELLGEYVDRLFSSKLKLTLTEDLKNKPLSEMGISSLAGLEIINTINLQLELNLDVTLLLKPQTIKTFEAYLVNLLWMKNTTPNEEGIII